MNPVMEHVFSLSPGKAGRAQHSVLNPDRKRIGQVTVSMASGIEPLMSGVGGDAAGRVVDLGWRLPGSGPDGGVYRLTRPGRDGRVGHSRADVVPMRRTQRVRPTSALVRSLMRERAAARRGRLLARNSAVLLGSRGM
jgi:hypothetical protein